MQAKSGQEITKYQEPYESQVTENLHEKGSVVKPLIEMQGRVLGLPFSLCSHVLTLQKLLAYSFPVGLDTA